MQRILTALVLIPLVVALVLWGPPLLMVAVQALVALAGVWEFFRLAEAAHFQVIRIPGYLCTIAFSLLSAQGVMRTYVAGIQGIAGDDLESFGQAQASAFPLPAAAGAVAVIFLGVLMVAAMRPGKSLSDYIGSVATSFCGPVYVALPLTLLVWVWMQSDGPWHVLFALVVIWLGDTAGFFFGRAFGKHKSSPRISPNKTWEGTAASFTTALLVGLATGLYFWERKSITEPIVLAGLLNVAAQWGDLAESALKRNAGVKDSSNLIPGHGGVLDRIDALLFAAPVLWYYWLWKAF